MRCRLLKSCLLSLLLGTMIAISAKAETRSFRLGAPEALAQTGFLKYLLPRFSLKTGIRIELVPEGEAAEAVIAVEAPGIPVFSGLGKDWVLAVVEPRDPHAASFEDWLAGDVGRKTIEAFKPGGTAIFAAAAARSETVRPLLVDGDAAAGERLSVRHCGRCHMVNEATRMTSIGSTPSFAVLRGLSNWHERFESFFARNPHPAFTIIDGVTEPFDSNRPPPIVPLEISLGELDAILAFVSRIPPADLGAPIQYQ
ncbi:hypothetical protein [Roseibium sp.]|uniref:hypothetical protein n=1 Tax=Roseibium sp. TaxID=1936156 RepID=UPI003D1098C1